MLIIMSRSGMVKLFFFEVPSYRFSLKFRLIAEEPVWLKDAAVPARD